MPMKCFILLFLVLIPALSLSQDLIITNSGDSIECTITLVNDQNIFYTYKKKKRDESTYISLEKVDVYLVSGSEIQPAPEIIEIPSMVVEPPQRMKRIGTVITGFIFQGIGSIFTIVATAGILDVQDGRSIIYIGSGLNTIGIILIVSGFQREQGT